MLQPYRRHLETCPHKQGGRAFTKCTCPIHCDGQVSGRRVRKSLKTTNWARALRNMTELEDDAASGRIRKPVHEAIAAFLASRQGEPETVRKRELVFGYLRNFAERRGITSLDRFTLEDLDAYRLQRPINALSWSKELQRLRTFFEFCRRRKWCSENPARDMEMPPDPKPKPREPYSADEIARIIAACDTFGQSEYERLRARAMILLMRYYGLRISDVATLERSRVSDSEISLYAMKNGKPVCGRMFPQVWFALSVVPAPKGAAADSQYFFWNGTGSVRNHIDSVGRTLKAVFRKSGVLDAHSHRFRYTLATEILAKGGSIEYAASILGDTPAIIRKYYAKFSPDFQHRLNETLERVHGTPVTHEKNFRASALDASLGVVPGAGLEKSKGKKPC